MLERLQHDLGPLVLRVFVQGGLYGVHHAGRNLARTEKHPAIVAFIRYEGEKVMFDAVLALVKRHAAGDTVSANDKMKENAEEKM